MRAENNNRRLALAPPACAAAEAGAGDTVGEYLEEWLWGKQSLRPSTHASYETHVRRYLKPHLGAVALTALRPTHLQHMYRDLSRADGHRARPLTDATLRRVHATLMSALNTAVRRGLIDRNPAATVELRRPSRPTLRCWTSDELAQFLDDTRNDRLHLLFLVLGLLGLRRGEAVALRWSEVDLNAGRVRIERSTVRVGAQVVVDAPKTARGSRTLAVDDETCRRLTWHQCRQRLEVLEETGAPTTPELVFTTPQGTSLDPAWVSRHFNRLVAATGLPRIRLHDLRHTSASIGLASGESLVEVSHRLGHSSIVITADTYSHVAPSIARRSADRLAASIYGRGEQEPRP